MRGRYRDSPDAPCAPRRPCTAFPITGSSHLGGTFVTADELALTHPYHPKSVVYVRVPSWCYTVNGFGQMYVDIYLPVQYHAEWFHHPKDSSVLRLCIPPSPSTPRRHWSFYCLHSFASSRMSCGWNHIVRSLFFHLGFVSPRRMAHFLFCTEQRSVDAPQFICSSTEGRPVAPGIRQL